MSLKTYQYRRWDNYALLSTLVYQKIGGIKTVAYFKKSGTKWQAQISWYDSDNKRQHKTKSGFDTKPQALK